MLCYPTPEKQVERRLAEIKGQFSQGAEAVHAFVRDVRTLKTLKPVLEQRRDERMFALEYGIEDDEFF